MDVNKLVALPWMIQLAIGSGYAAYLAAYAGIRDHHKPTDAALTSLVFSLVASATLAIAQPRLGGLWASCLAFTVTLLSGIAWRRFGRGLVKRMLWRLNVSWADDTPSAWAAILGNSRHPLTQVAVQLDDGTWLRCDDASLFENVPFGACVLGTNGDIALYLTHEEPPGGPARQLTSVRDADYGDRITYVPAARVRQVTMRHKDRL